MVKTEIRLWYFCGQTGKSPQLSLRRFPVLVDGKGIEPSTSAMRTPRSPSWANRPNRPFFNQKSCKKRIFEIFNFEGIVRKTEQKIGRKNRAGDGGPYGCEPNALPTELRARLCLVWINLTYLDYAICWSAWARVISRLLSQTELRAQINSSKSGTEE